MANWGDELRNRVLPSGQKLGDYVSVEHTMTGSGNYLQLTGQYVNQGLEPVYEDYSNYKRRSALMQDPSINPCAEQVLEQGYWNSSSMFLRDPTRTVLYSFVPKTEYKVYAFYRMAKAMGLGWGAGYILIDYNHPFYNTQLKYIQEVLDDVSLTFDVLGHQDCVKYWPELDSSFKNMNYRILGFHTADTGSGEVIDDMSVVIDKVNKFKERLRFV